MSYVGPITKNILDGCINEMKKKHMRDKLSKYIINPIFTQILYEIYPYLLAFGFTHVLIIILLVANLIITGMSSYKKNA